MKIGISCWPTFGGSGAVATELGIALADRGHEVHFITYAPPFRLPDLRTDIRFHEVTVSAYPLFRYPPYDAALAAKMAEVSESAGLDLLHVHYAMPHAVAALLARELLRGGGPRIVATLHGTDITVVGADPAYRRITCFAIDRVDGVTAVSRWLAEETAREFATRRPIRVVPNFVDLERFRPGGEPGVRATLARPGEALLVHISNFRPVKRLRDVIAVFAAVRKDRPARLVLVGDGPDRAGAEEEARRLGVAKDVAFLGEQAGIEGLLGVADLFLLPSDRESFGLAALEAMACGVPVIGTDTGGLPEVVEDGKTGHLCTPGDTACMSAFATELLADPARHAAFRAAARAAAGRFDRAKVVDAYEAVYREVGAGK